MSQVPTEFNVV